jgi:abortive infection bacteriophage resistance protein
MEYLKSAISIEEQADLLLARGLILPREDLISKLGNVGYYRLSGYWYPFRTSDNKIVTGTTFEKIWNRYTFDRELRLLVLDGIERIEMMLRASLVQFHAQEYGPFGYVNKQEKRKVLRNKTSHLLAELVSDLSEN